MRRYEAVSGTVFALFAVAHLIRVALRWPAQVAGVPVPLWLSVLAALVSACLAVWAFRLTRDGPTAAAAAVGARPSERAV